MQRIHVFRLAFCLIVALAMFTTLSAQTTGTISGVVRDATGGVIPGVEVKVTNTETGVSRTVVTDDSGFYLATNVAVGTYAVSVELAGFRRASVTGIKIDIRSNRTVDLTMEVGGTADEVTVESSSVAQVELRSGEVSNLISAEQVSELPLNGRSFVQLSLLVPGASAARDANPRFTGLFGGVDISFSGSPSNANLWLVDGTNNVDIGSGRTILTYPSVDSIAEFKISRNLYGADSAASSGAQINVVTKSGTNEFHGSIYEFHRNSALNATDFFLNRAGEPKQSLVYNNFGYTLGGPIAKDRAFFFWSQEWRREGRGVPRQRLVPSLAERTGDFSGPNTRGYPDPVDPFTGLPFLNNQIPSDRLSPAGLAIMGLYPAPTVPVDSPRFGGFNWVAAPTTPINTRQEQFRGDVVINDQHSVMGRITLDTWKNQSPSFIEGGLWGDDPFPQVDSDWDQPGNSLTTMWTSTFGTNIVNQVSFSWSGNEITITRGAGENINAAITSAIPEVFPGPDDRAHLTIWGDATGNGDIWHQPPWQNEQDLYVWKDDFSWVKGDHSMKFGVLVSRNRKDEDINGNGPAYSPAFWTDGGRAIPAGWAGGSSFVDSTGNGIADMLLRGTAWGGGTENSTNPRSKVRWRDYEFYFADTWRVDPKFTLNYGVRWSYLPNPYDADGRIANFLLGLYDPAEGATSTNGLIFPENCDVCPVGIRGVDVDGKSLVKNHSFDIAPRLGFAWDPTGSGKWAIRGGAGIFFNREAISDVLFMSINPPFNTVIFWNSARALDSLPPDIGFSGGEGVAQRGKDIQAKTPGSYQWNLTIERELWKDTKFEIAYVANRGHHVPTQLFLNQVPVADRTAYAIQTICATRDGNGNCMGDGQGAAANYRPLFPLVGDSTAPLTVARSADSWYHSFQAYLVKRFSNNLSYQASYTFSKLLSTAFGLGHVSGNTISDPFNIGYDKGLASFDRTHLFNFNVIYRTPQLADRTGLVRHLLGDWETSVIFTGNSGVPETIGCCSNFTGTQSNRPDLVGNSEGPQTVDRWFNTAAFAPPSRVGVLGTAPRGAYRGPGIANWDFSVMKNFAGLPWFTQEGMTIQFRAEFFNFLNHTQFQAVNNGFDIANVQIDDSGNLTDYTLTNPNFGAISSIREPREIQFGLKIIW